jgi:hypothetical protein
VAKRIAAHLQRVEDLLMMGVDDGND